MKKIGIVAVLSLIAGAGLLATGCGNGGGSGVSCDLKMGASHICTTYDYGSLDPTGAAASAEMTACTDAKGTAGESCPTTNALGTCTLKAVAGVTSSETFYSDTTPATTKAEATMACTSAGGTFM